MRYGVILADPPWPEHGKATAGVSRRSMAVRHFGVMSGPEIVKLPVQHVADDPAALFLWTTWRHLALALETMQTWGFRHVGCAFVWRKVTQSGGPTFGLGYYTHGNTEPCLLGIRGYHHVPADRSIRAEVEAPIGKFAAKPEEVVRRIERMYPNAHKLELFGRHRRPGWKVLGNEVDGKRIEQSLVALAKRPQV